MSPFLLIAVIVLVTLVLLAAVFAVANVAMKQLGARQRRAALERFPQARLVIAGASFFGQESRGVAQMRGNGTLVLADAELYFELWLPRREYRIPLRAIWSVDTVSSHLGKTIARPLVRVVFENEAGQSDSMAWYVPDTDELKQTLEAALR